MSTTKGWFHERVAHVARQAKHRVSVFVKHASWGFPYQRGPLFEPFHAARQRRHPFVFPQEKYEDAWFATPISARSIPTGESVSRRIFCLWTGDNEMSVTRRSNFDRLAHQNPSIDVVLVTPGNLDEWLVAGQPLHPDYECLSLVHRSDYLRAYLLHHHGGGYADIKRFQHEWAPSFEAFECSQAWLAGYTEAHRLLIPLVGGELQADLRRASRQLLGYGGLIARPHSGLTNLWLDRVHLIMDRVSADLAEHPGNVRGDNPGYPLGWTEILASVVAPLTWRYQEHVIHDERLRPELKDYL